MKHTILMGLLLICTGVALAQTDLADCEVSVWLSEDDTTPVGEFVDMVTAWDGAENIGDIVEIVNAAEAYRDEVEAMPVPACLEFVKAQALDGMNRYIEVMTATDNLYNVTDEQIILLIQAMAAFGRADGYLTAIEHAQATS